MDAHTYAHMEDGHQAIRKAYPEHSSSELKKNKKSEIIGNLLIYQQIL